MREVYGNGVIDGLKDLEKGKATNTSASLVSKVASEWWCTSAAVQYQAGLEQDRLWLTKNKGVENTDVVEQTGWMVGPPDTERTHPWGPNHPL